MKKKIIAIIQAHMSSTRLPEKVMKDICGKPELYRMLERVRQSTMLDDIVVATSDLPCDDIIIEKCAEWGIHTYRGSDSDVLERYYGAARAYPADIYARMTSDCPLLDPRTVDGEIRFFLDHDYRYINNGCCREESTFPVGMGFEMFTAELLREAYDNSTESFEHEHVTPYMYMKQSSRGVFRYREDAAEYRLTLDTPADYEVICRVYEALLGEKNDFTIEDILAYLRANPEVAAINSNIVQKKATD